MRNVPPALRLPATHTARISFCSMFISLCIYKRLSSWAVHTCVVARGLLIRNLVRKRAAHGYQPLRFGMLFVDTIGSRSAQSGLMTAIKTSRSHKATVDDLRPADSCRTRKTYNNGGNTQHGLADSSPLDLTREIRQKTTRRAPSDNISEIKCPKGRRQNGGTIEATAQLLLPADISGLNLSRSSGAQEPTKAAATAGTSQPYVCRPGLKQIPSDVSSGAVQDSSNRQESPGPDPPQSTLRTQRPEKQVMFWPRPLRPR